MLKRLFPLAALLVLAAAIGAADEKAAVKSDPAAIRKFVEQLGSEDFRTREKATQELSKLEEVPDELRAATKSADPEVCRRAQSAAIAITARAEDKAFRAVLQKVELDRFVRRMVTEANFANDEQWKFVQTLARALPAKASELGGRHVKVSDLDMKSLPQQTGPPSETTEGNKGMRILLSDSKSKLFSVSGCVILSAGPMPEITSLTDSIVIVDGDYSGGICVHNCLLVVRGNIGHITSVSHSVILATGECKGVYGSRDSFYQVGNKHLRFQNAQNNVLVKSTLKDPKRPDPEQPINHVKNRILDTEHGPLQMLKFSELKKNQAPKPEKQ